MTFDGKHVTLVGLGLRSGVAVAQLLCELGAQVCVSDQKSAGELQAAIEQLKGYPIRFVLGGHPSTILEEADVVVVSPGVPWEAPILQQARQRGLPVLGELEVAGQLCQAPIVAITGTKGKSTTTALTGAILKASGKFPRVLMGGNIGVAFSRGVRELTSKDVAVVEVSSFQLEAIVNFHPAVSVITNLQPDHFDRHGNMENYIKAKARVFLNQTEADFILLNRDDPRTRRLAESAKAQVLWFGLSRSECVPGRRRSLPFETYLDGERLIVRQQNSCEVVCDRGEIRLLGLHNVTNVLAACLIAAVKGVPVEVMRQVVLEFEPPPHTLEVVRKAGDVCFINDSKATNIMATQAALEAVDPPVILILGGYDKGNDYRLLMSLVREKVALLIRMGTDTRKIADAFEGLVPMLEADGMESAVAIARDHLEGIRTVLFSPACASFDLFQDYRERGERFRQAVARLDLSKFQQTTQLLAT